MFAGAASFDHPLASWKVRQRHEYARDVQRRLVVQAPARGMADRQRHEYVSTCSRAPRRSFSPWAAGNCERAARLHPCSPRQISITVVRSSREAEAPAPAPGTAVPEAEGRCERAAGPRGRGRRRRSHGRGGSRGDRGGAPHGRDRRGGGSRRVGGCIISVRSLVGGPLRQRAHRPARHRRRLHVGLRDRYVLEVVLLVGGASEIGRSAPGRPFGYEARTSWFGGESKVRFTRFGSNGGAVKPGAVAVAGRPCRRHRTCLTREEHGLGGGPPWSTASPRPVSPIRGRPPTPRLAAHFAACFERRGLHAGLHGR